MNIFQYKDNEELKLYRERKIVTSVYNNDQYPIIFYQKFNQT